MSSPGETQQRRNTHHDLKESENEAVLLTTKTPLQTLHLGDSALDHPENGQARPEDPAGA